MKIQSDNLDYMMFNKNNLKSVNFDSVKEDEEESK
jgi:hypothetical protein